MPSPAEVKIAEYQGKPLPETASPQAVLAIIVTNGMRAEVHSAPVLPVGRPETEDEEIIYVS